MAIVDRIATIWLAMELGDARSRQKSAEHDLAEVDRAQQAVRHVDAAGLAGLERLRAYYARLKQ